MPLESTLVGSLVTGAKASDSQIVAKIACYTSCQKDANGKYCVPQVVCGFMDTLTSMDRLNVSDGIRMRHLPMRYEFTQHSPSTIDRISNAVSTAQKVYGIATYTVGRAATPYVAQAAADD